MNSAVPYDEAPGISVPYGTHTLKMQYLTSKAAAYIFRYCSHANLLAAYIVLYSFSESSLRDPALPLYTSRLEGKIIFAFDCCFL
jgi:hypothetical protein